MATTCSSHRGRVARPVLCPADMHRVLMVATDDGRSPVCALGLLDQDRRPLLMTIVDDFPGEPEDVRYMVDLLLTAIDTASGKSKSLFIGSTRPGTALEPTAEEVAMWPGLVARCAVSGITLLDWFVIGEGASRSVPGADARW